MSSLNVRQPLNSTDFLDFVENEDIDSALGAIASNLEAPLELPAGMTHGFLLQPTPRMLTLQASTSSPQASPTTSGTTTPKLSQTLPTAADTIPRSSHTVAVARTVARSNVVSNVVLCTNFAYYK